MRQVTLTTERVTLHVAYWAPDFFRPMNEDPVPWGQHSFRLVLPSSSITIDGLSQQQHISLDQAYSPFAVRFSGETGDYQFPCKVGRLTDPIELPVGALTRDGQYTPIVQREQDGVRVTGVNFMAHIHFGGDRAPHSSLYVSCEEELPQPMVIENFLRILLAHRVLALGGVLLHSCGLVVEGRAYLFAGRSNAGKTTLAHKADSHGIRVLGDDINCLLPGDGGFLAHAVPFTGEFGRRQELRPDAVALAGVLLLEKGPELRVGPVRPSRAVASLLSGCPFVNSDAAGFPLLMDALTALVDRTPMAHLTVAREDGFPEIMHAVREALNHD